MFNQKIICRTLIPKNRFVRPEFFESFYFLIMEEKEDEYWLEIDNNKISKQNIYIYIYRW